VVQDLELEPQSATKGAGTLKNRCVVIEILTEPNQALHPTAAASRLSEALRLTGGRRG
jgi:hypothetical protein